MRACSSCGKSVELTVTECPNCGELVKPAFASDARSVASRKSSVPPPPPPLCTPDRPAASLPLHTTSPMSSSSALSSLASPPLSPVLSLDTTGGSELKITAASPPGTLPVNSGTLLDVSQIVDLVQQHKVEYEQMESLNITLLLGETGAGKSTTVNFLSGRKFCEKKVEVERVMGNGQKMKFPKTIIECVEPLEHFMIGHTADAQTRFLRVHQTGKGLNLCDAPGFEDTSGPNVDISNAIAIANVLRRSKGVVILLLIKYASLDHERGQGLKKVVELLARFIPTISDTNFASVRCVFTHVPQEKSFGDVASKIDELQQATYIQSHPIMLQFLAWLLNTLVTFQETIVIRPLTQEAAPLHQLIMESPPLKQLDGITVPLAHNSSFVLAQYCQKVAGAMSSLQLTNVDPSQRDDIKRMLLNLKILAQETRLPELDAQWQYCEKVTQRATTELCLQLNDAFERAKFFEAQQLLATLEWIADMTGASLLEPVTKFVGMLCERYLAALATSVNLSTLCFPLIHARMLQENFIKVLPLEYKEIYSMCTQTAQNIAGRYQEWLKEEIISKDNFALVSSELKLLSEGVESCQSVIDFSGLKLDILNFARTRLKKHVAVAVQFLDAWSAIYDQAPNVTVDGVNHAAIPYSPPPEPLPSLSALPVIEDKVTISTAAPSPSYSAVPAPYPVSTPSSAISSTMSISRSFMTKVESLKFDKTADEFAAAPRARTTHDAPEESKEEEKHAVIVLEGRKKLSVDVNVGGPYGRKVGWSFAVPDKNKITFTATLRDPKNVQKPNVICSLISDTHVGNYEIPFRGSRVMTFQWENKASALGLKSPKPVEFVYALKVTSTAWPPLTNSAASSPARPSPARPAASAAAASSGTPASHCPPPSHPPPPPPPPAYHTVVDEKAEQRLWSQVVTNELSISIPEGGRNLVFNSAALSSALLALITGASSYRALSESLGEEAVQELMICSNFIDDLQARIHTMQNQRGQGDLQGLSVNVWRIWVFSRLSIPELKYLISECANLYEALLQASNTTLHSLVEQASTIPATNWRLLEEHARVWLLLKLSNQKDLITLLKKARTLICDRLSRFFQAVLSYGCKQLANVFVEEIAPFRSYYPNAVAVFTNRMLQRVMNQLQVTELISLQTGQVIEDVYSAILLLQEKGGPEMREGIEDVIRNYEQVIHRVVDAILMQVYLDFRLPDASFAACLGDAFLVFAYFSTLKGKTVQRRQHEVDQSYELCVQELRRLVVDPSLSAKLRLFFEWACTRPDKTEAVFRRVVAMVDEHAPELKSEITSAFPHVHSTVPELDRLRSSLQRVSFLIELCQKRCAKMIATLEGVENELCNKEFELLQILRDSRPPPPALTDVLSTCAGDSVICRRGFRKEWETYMMKCKNDSIVCQRSWNAYLDYLTTQCHKFSKTGMVFQEAKLLACLEKPLFESLQFIYLANLPFTITHALSSLKDWWKEAVKLVCGSENLVTLVDDKLDINTEVLANVQAFWRAHFVIELTLTKLTGAGFVAPGAIESFSRSDLRQWFLEFLGKASVAGVSAAQELYLPAVNKLIGVIGHIEQLISAQDAQKERPYTEGVISACRSRINLSRKLCQEGKTAEDRCRLIVEVRQWSIVVDHAELTKLVKESIEEILKTTGPTVLAEMGPLLEAGTTYGEVGQRLVQEYETFHLERVRILNRETGSITFEGALKEMSDRNQEKGYPLDIFKLTNAWKRYLESNGKLLGPLVMDGKMKVEDAVKATIKLVKDKADISVILAHCSAVFSALKAKGTLNGADDVTKPHATQILALFSVMLDESKENHLVEVGTGEGKSIILGLLATILALQGFEVHVACYSRALVDRDKKSFLDVFEAFGVQSLIKYNTFAGLVSDLIARVGDIRALTEAMILCKDEKKKEKLSRVTRSRILLIDEVDVFLHPEVYGASNQPLLIMRSAPITELCKHIFHNYDKGLKLAAIQKLEAYCIVQREFIPEAHPLLDACLLQLLADVKQVTNPQFAYTIVKANGKNVLGYQTLEGVDTETSWRGITMFQCMKEHAKGTIDASVLSEVVGFYIGCGAYSYAAIPKEYLRVIGVTGTYEQLGAREKRILREDYQIKKTTLTASMYGSRRDRLDREAVRVASSEDAHYGLIRETVDRIRRPSAEKKPVPPILLFFENESTIRKFQLQKKNSDWIADLRGSFYVVKESCDNLEFVMTKSMLAGGVTAFPAIFGRGLDFRCFVPLIDEQRGVHVIQTFLSPEISEEVQIQGRTARQKHRGTFIQLLCEVQLNKQFGIQTVDLQRASSKGELYPFIDSVRQRWFSEKAGTRQQRVAEAETMHKKTWQFLVHLAEFRASMDFIISLNPAPPQPPMKQSRTLCLSDATGSMGTVWEGTKAVLNEMLTRLEDMGGGENFKLKWVAYRDYDCEDRVTESSSWSSQPSVISAFLAGVDIGGGQDWPEAIEEGLRVVNEEAEPPTRVLLFGDAPPHAEKAGEAIVGQDNHVLVTDYMAECSKLAKKGIPIFAFYIGEGQTKTTFEAMAEATGGQAKPLKDAADLLDVIAINVLEDMGGSDLVAEYYAKYKGKTT